MAIVRPTTPTMKSIGTRSRSDATIAPMSAPMFTVLAMTSSATSGYSTRWP